MPRVAVVLVGLLFAGGCADSAAPIYVSPHRFQQLTCQELAARMVAASEHAAELSSSRPSTGSAYVAAIGDKGLIGALAKAQEVDAANNAPIARR